TLFEHARSRFSGLSRATPNSNHKAERTAVIRALAKFLSMILVVACMQPPPAGAQLGSLIVTVTAPRTGSTVNGTITVSASVTSVGSLTVAGVQFKLNGTDLGAEVTKAPYS